MTFQVECLTYFPGRMDNHAPIFADDQGWIAVDPGESEPIEKFLNNSNLPLIGILITHHDWDHVDGVAALKAQYGCTVYGPAKSIKKLGWIDVPLRGGETLELAQQKIEVIATPGHTLDHLAYYLPNQKLLFSADCLFSLGCGRIFEGTPEMMWQSLLTLRALPDETKVYCGHEYSLSNAKFALTIDPDNAALQTKADRINQQRENGQPTVPFSLGEDKKANPFLRADDPKLAQILGMEGADPSLVFAEIRRQKDNF